MLGCETTRVAGHRPGPEGPPAEPPTQLLGASASGGRNGVPGDRDGGVIAARCARVSPDKQEKHETIASQLAALPRAAADGHFEVAPEHVFVDAHHSGARLDRLALDRLRDLAAEGTLEAVLVSSPDRLARQYAHQVLLVEELTRAGCRVVFLNHPCAESPEQQMLLQIQGVFAKYERYADIGIMPIMPIIRGLPCGRLRRPTSGRPGVARHLLASQDPR